MKIAVRYSTKTGNTKRLADAIAEAAGVDALDVTHPITEDMDVLFLGSSVYAAGVDSAVRDFISGIRVNVGRVVNFSTAALLPSTYKQVKKLVEAKGFVMSKKEYHCRGAFQFMHKGKPDAADCAAAAKFATSVLSSSGGSCHGAKP